MEGEVLENDILSGYVLVDGFSTAWVYTVNLKASLVIITGDRDTHRWGSHFPVIEVTL